MNLPLLSAEASLYATRNRYYSATAGFDTVVPDGSVVPAYIPGPETLNRCSGCTDVCVAVRDVCLAKVAVTVTEACFASLGLGCGAAIALGYIQAGSCESSY